MQVIERVEVEVEGQSITLERLEDGTFREPDYLTKAKHPESERFAGWGSAVKPAYEPIVCARKPLSEKNLASNVLKHSTGGINVEASRVDGKRFPSNLLLSHVPGPNGCVRVGSRRVKGSNGVRGRGSDIYANGKGFANTLNEVGQEVGYADPDGLEEVPEYICADSCPILALDEQSGVSKGATTGGKAARSTESYEAGDDGSWNRPLGKYNVYRSRSIVSHNDKGGASRFFQTFSPDPNPGFFYSPKASKRERQAGLDGLPAKFAPTMGNGIGGKEHDPETATPKQNVHPTVKPLSLMCYLLKLVTPPNGTCLDPFAGSGTTGVAALSEGFNAILIEQDEEYCEIAEKRILYHSLPEAERVETPTPKQVKARNTYGFKTTDVLRRCPEHNESIPSGSTKYKCGCEKVWYKVEERMKKGEVKTAREWGLTNMHPQDMLLRYNPDERPEEGGTYSPVKEAWEDKRTGPEPGDLNFREVVEKYASALSKTEEQFKDKLF